MDREFIPRADCRDRTLYRIDSRNLRLGVFKELLCSPGRGRLSLDLGLTTEGLFIDANGLVTNTLAVGVGTPLAKGPLRAEPYVALQLVL